MSTVDSQTENTRRPWLVRFLRGCFRWRTIRAIGFGVFCLITLLFLAVAVENWRGKRAWEQYRKEQEAKGERFDLASCAPKPVPAEQNFFMTPYFAAMQISPASSDVMGSGGESVTRLPPVIDAGSGLRGDSPMGGNVDKGMFENIKGWREFYESNTNYPPASDSLSDAEAVLVALSKYDPIVAELRKANRRPHAILPVDYTNPASLLEEDHFGGLMSLLARFKGLSQFFRLLACAELEAGRPAEALEDIEVGLRFEEGLGKDPLLISQLVRIAILHVMLQPVWEGMAEHRWSEQQLAALQDRFSSMDYLTSFQNTILGERAFNNAIQESRRRSGSGNQTDEEPETGSRARPSFLDLAPRGWLYQNQLAANRFCTEVALPVVDPDQHRVNLDRLRQMRDWPENNSGPYKVTARTLAPTLAKILPKFARSQASADLVTVACALERYRIAEGEYPERPEAVVPKFLAKLPPDIITGEPLGYRRTGDGRFVLYSVGMNGKDDGGESGMTKGGAVSILEGDWVWRYPEK